MPTDIDYSKLKKWIEYHKNCIALRDKILSLVPLKLLYSEYSNLEFGYFRAKNFVRMFNKEYGTNLDLQVLDQIIETVNLKKNIFCKKLQK